MYSCCISANYESPTTFYHHKSSFLDDKYDNTGDSP